MSLHPQLFRYQSTSGFHSPTFTWRWPWVGEVLVEFNSRDVSAPEKTPTFFECLTVPYQRQKILLGSSSFRTVCVAHFMNTDKLRDIHVHSSWSVLTWTTETLPTSSLEVSAPTEVCAWRFVSKRWQNPASTQQRFFQVNSQNKLRQGRLPTGRSKQCTFRPI